MRNASSTNRIPDRPRLREADGIAGLDPAAWNALLAAAGPFTDHRFLAALETGACVGGATGWTPRPLLAADSEGRLLAAAPAYIKQHGHGEFVFDWHWASASERAGLPWYPKLVVAVPYTPVTGPRLIGADRHPGAALALARGLERAVEENRLSSAAVNFCDEADADVLRRAGWLERCGWQYHWKNPGYRDFEDFLDTLRHKARSNIRRERRLVQEAGWEFEWRGGGDLDDSALDFVFRCYRNTFLAYGNPPMLTRAFFGHAARAFGERFLVCVARRAGRARACAMLWQDRDRLYGRYWGGLEETRDVHFEACYYQGIEHCIRTGLSAFEPGAQGEHKIRRGFLPASTRSFHYIRHPVLRQAIAGWLTRERNALDELERELASLSPYKSAR